LLPEVGARELAVDLKTILVKASEAGASDVHLVAGQPPVIRVHQVIQPMDMPVITKEDAVRIFQEMASKETQATFEKNKDADFSYAVEGLARYRVNAHMQKSMLGMAMRAIKTKVPPLAALNLAWCW
jgi:twitching motility protein PilT